MFKASVTVSLRCIILSKMSLYIVKISVLIFKMFNKLLRNVTFSDYKTGVSSIFSELRRNFTTVPGGGNAQN